MEIPAFAEDGHDGRAGFDEGEKLRVLGGGDILAPGAAESGELGVVESVTLHPLEEAHGFRVRAGPSAFDVIDAEVVQALGDAHLVFKGEADEFALLAVSQGGVVDQNVF